MGDEPQPSTSPEPVQARAQRLGGSTLPLEQVPAEVHRRAVQLLEDVRGTSSAEKWKSATLLSEVRVLLRPDVEGPAYYEFRVLVDGKPSGFIVASAGSHDFPIAHWDFEGLSPTEQLDKQAKGAEISAYYKVDALSYVAESPSGEQLALLGTLPPRIVGQDPSWLDKPVEPTTATYVPDSIPSSDEKGVPGGGKIVIEGPREPKPIELTGWESWKKLKDGYRESFATMAESLRRQAAGEWETEALAKESGEGLVSERPFELALLYPKAEVTLSGDGAHRVEVKRVDTAPGRQILVLTAHDAERGKELPLGLKISYDNGFSEQLSFVVLSAEDVGTPEGKAQGAADTQGTSWVDAPGMLGPWSAWNTFWAGTNSDQRFYNQIPAGSAPNTSSCYSGCGGTAWAMLFGWGDNQAALGNPAWAHRTGLYLQNGGTGADAVAPQYMDTGVRNMSWELRNRIGTFCAGSSGATPPWSMSGASGYLALRTGTTLSTHYNVLGIHEGGLRDRARDSIIYRRVPAIIGTGWLSHYPLAYGYRWRSRVVRKCFIFCWNETEYQREFYVNQGWGGGGNGWVGAGTWFAGHIYAN
jgi:hypothetical protein